MPEKMNSRLIGKETFDFLPEFDHIQIKLAKPEQIRLWSHGEVRKAETINYRTLKPEPEGLFCEVIFGPEKDYECHCGKYKRIRYKGQICERCRVEVTTSRVRRERMGHIELAAPVAHVWFLRGIPSRIALLLDVPLRSLERVAYFAWYIVTDPGKGTLSYEYKGKNKEVTYKQPIPPEEYDYLVAKFGANAFKVSMGAEAIKKLLSDIDLDKLSSELHKELERASGSIQRRVKAAKRLEIVEAFRKSEQRPEWMIIEALPVIPPDLRPLVPLDGGRFATSDLNDLYRRVINRNNRLKKLIEVSAPDIIIRNEKRMLQEAVDALIDNGRRSRPIVGAGNRPLRSLSDMLKGKQGRFRQNLLGKRVDYSGRSVIVVGPDLTIDQCGLPKEMALEMFKPFVMKKIVEKGYVHNIKSAKRMIERQRPEVWELLEEVIKGHPVLLNRAPTLHRLGIQAFEPVLVEGKAIKIHPLVCTAFNADFDGDQMAVHIPLSLAAQAEARVLMLSAYNLLSPANGKPLAAPQRDIIVGCYYITLEREGDLGQGKYFADAQEAIRAEEAKVISIFSPIWVKIDRPLDVVTKTGMEHVKGRMLTTAGRLIFNKVVGESLGEDALRFPYYNQEMPKRELSRMVSQIYRRFGVTKTARLLDALKKLGFDESTQAGITIGIDDFKVPHEKKQILAEAENSVREVEDEFAMGLLTDNERYLRVVDIWQDATDKMEKNALSNMDPFDSVYMLAKSGARGDPKQVRQIVGMRGLMADPSGKIIEFPIKSSLRDGLTTLEYFISTHGARKGLADTAIKTADAGYLTRRLVDVAQEVVVQEEDCLTSELRLQKRGLLVEKKVGEQALGKYLAIPVHDPKTGHVLAAEGDYVDQELAERINAAGVKSVTVANKLDFVELGDITEGKNVIEPMVERILGRVAAVDLKIPLTITRSESTLSLGQRVLGKELAEDLLIHQVEIPRGTVLKAKDLEKLHALGRTTVPTFVSLGQQALGKILVSDLRNPRSRKIIARAGAPVDPKLAERIDGLALESLQVMTKDGAPGQIMTLTVNAPFSEVALAQATGKALAHDALRSTLLAKRGKVVDSALAKDIDENGLEAVTVLETLVPAGEEIGEEAIEVLSKLEDPSGERLIKSVRVRSVLTCQSHHSVCAKCYGRDLASGRMVTVGEAVGIVAAQSIGEPGTQLTLRTFHTGGIAEADITTGLPRVEELFEARRPRGQATVSEIMGKVKITDGKEERIIQVSNAETKESKEYKVSFGARLRVANGDEVSVGERLTEGPLNPSDVLRFKGPKECQQYLLQEVQKVYKSQGVDINDKHVELIIRQLLRKIRIEDPGDTRFLPGDQLDHVELEEENRRMDVLRLRRATSRRVLLGVTKSALATDSFLSAAAFQETTRVLTEASMKGKIDRLQGLKENVIIGSLIPAGSGLPVYRETSIFGEDEPEEGILEEAPEVHSLELPPGFNSANVPKSEMEAEGEQGPS
jgi:DNA-directed RNA polymerase subunit beta'